MFLLGRSPMIIVADDEPDILRYIREVLQRVTDRLQFQCIEEQRAYYLIGQRPNLECVLNRLRARTSWHL